MNFPFRPTCVFIWHFFLPNPLPLETVSKCHPEAVAEGSRICKELQSLDSSPAAQNDIRMIFTLRHSLSRERKFNNFTAGDKSATFSFRLCSRATRVLVALSLIPPLPENI